MNNEGTVGDLVRELLKMPQDAKVVINLNEGSSFYYYGNIPMFPIVTMVESGAVVIESKYCGQGG